MAFRRLLHIGTVQKYILNRSSLHTESADPEETAFAKFSKYLRNLLHTLFGRLYNRCIWGFTIIAFHGKNLLITSLLRNLRHYCLLCKCCRAIERARTPHASRRLVAS